MMYVGGVNRNRINSQNISDTCAVCCHPLILLRALTRRLVRPYLTLLLCSLYTHTYLRPMHTAHLRTVHTRYLVHVRRTSGIVLLHLLAPSYTLVLQ